jgi:hypothetical protein
VGTRRDMIELINQWLWKRSIAFYRSCPKAPTDVQGIVWLTDSCGTEWGTEALRVKRDVKEGSGDGASLSVGAVRGEPGRGAPVLGTYKGM